MSMSGTFPSAIRFNLRFNQELSPSPRAQEASLRHGNQALERKHRHWLIGFALLCSCRLIDSCPVRIPFLSGLRR